MIDANKPLNEISSIGITTNGKPNIPRALRDELVDFIRRTTPLTREEIEADQLLDAVLEGK